MVTSLTEKGEEAMRHVRLLIAAALLTGVFGIGMVACKSSKKSAPTSTPVATQKAGANTATPAAAKTGTPTTGAGTPSASKTSTPSVRGVPTATPY